MSAKLQMATITAWGFIWLVTALTQKIKPMPKPLAIVLTGNAGVAFVTSFISAGLAPVSVFTGAHFTWWLAVLWNTGGRDRLTRLAGKVRDLGHRLIVVPA